MLEPLVPEPPVVEPVEPPELLPLLELPLAGAPGSLVPLLVGTPLPCACGLVVSPPHAAQSGRRHITVVKMKEAVGMGRSMKRQKLAGKARREGVGRSVVRQASLGEEKADVERKPHVAIRGWKSRPAKAGPPAGSESCMGASDRDREA